MAKRKKSIVVKPNEAEKKLNQVKRWILDGCSEFEITEAAARLWPGEKIKPMIGAVMDGLCDSSQFDTRVVVGWCFEATRDLYRRMVEAEDYQGALKAVKQMTELGSKYHVPIEQETEDKEVRDGEAEDPAKE